MKTDLEDNLEEQKDDDEYRQSNGGGGGWKSQWIVCHIYCFSNCTRKLVLFYSGAHRVEKQEARGPAHPYGELVPSDSFPPTSCELHAAVPTPNQATWKVTPSTLHRGHTDSYHTSQ